jgi:hypothetical protein
MSKLVTTYRNEADGVEARVFRVRDGYAVFVHDTDANQTVDGSARFPSERRARAYARRCADLPEGGS